MDYGALPPEVNSARMYSGAGSTPLLAAAGAWDAVASELRAAANGYASTIAGLSGSWVGPSSTAMSNAAAFYTAWLTDTADSAEQFAQQARTAAAAYETAFAAMVPPPVIAANRAQLAALTSTNIVGQNAAAIAHTEAQYAAMWSTDATAMYRYAAQSSAAANLSPVNSPPPTTNPTAGTTQALSHTAEATNIQAVLSHLTSTTPQALHSLATPATATTAPASSLADFLTALDQSPLATIAGNAEIVPQMVLPANSSLINTILGIAIGTKARDVAAAAAGAASSSLGAGLGSNAAAVSSEWLQAASGASASVGQAGSVGAVSVPPTWATATPAVRTIAAALSNAAPSAILPAAVSQSTLFAGAAVAGMSGSVAGNALSRRVFSSRTPTDVAESATRAAKSGDDKSSVNLQRLAASIAHSPQSVQHWNTTPEKLDDLLDELRKTPGTHAVHVTDAPGTSSRRQS